MKMPNLSIGTTILACVYRKGDNGMHTDYMFPMTAESIANFIGKNAYTADKIIMMDM